MGEGEAAAKRPEGAGESGRLHVLVVDDSELYRTHLEEELTAAGYEVETASGGVEALERAARRAPDLVLLDVVMDDLDGLEVCRRLRVKRETADVPIVLVTSQDKPEDTVRGLDVGASDYIGKPFNREILLARVRNQLQMKLGRDELKRLNVLKDEVLSIASHDLKGPLSSILALVAILMDSSAAPLTPFQQRSIGGIQDTALYMLGLVNNVLDIAKMEAGRMEIYPVEVQVAHIINLCVERNHFMAQRKGIELQVHVPRDLPPAVADPHKLNQVINNLLNNAVKFSAEGRPVEIGARTEGNQLRVWVRDRGPGIPETDQCLLFRKFSQTSVRAPTGDRGTGLGLAIVKQIVELHGGRVWVESRSGDGSLFAFEIPMKGEAFGK
ncbi:MAG: hybrid sensor histidine kinase/response regulator [Candidatus Wallbacteria bacterium]|nr:hybrid sensor histidine kinase/response regulator [Candidatus Wallbacteria bacterium]